MYRLSIITISYNSESTIEATIQSIVSQKNNLVEYIIIDGASTDSTLKIVNRYKDKIDKVVSEKDNGISDAFNKGIKLATGEYIGLINSDDMLLPGAVDSLLIDLDGKDDVIFGNGIRLFKDGTCKPYKSDPSPEKLQKDMTICHPATFVKKRAYERWGMFSKNYKCVMDRELLLRFLSNGATFRYIDKYFAVYRMGGMSDSLYLSCVLQEMYDIDKNIGLRPFSARRASLKRNVIFYMVKLRDTLGLDHKRKRFAELIKEYSSIENESEMEHTYKSGLISVIVPVHNTAKYLRQCVESICNQTYTNLQIILVEDGSEDGSDVICDSFTDKRIQVIHPIRQRGKIGVSCARNAGLDIADGEYIAFVDSDDFLHPTMYEKLVGLLKDNDVVFSACGYENYISSNRNANKDRKRYNTYYFDYEQSVDALCHTYMFMVWNKLFMHKNIADIRYDEWATFEDVGYFRRVFERIEKTVYYEEPLYVYRIMNTGSASFTRDRYFHENKMRVIEEYELFIDSLVKRNCYRQARLMRGEQLGRIKHIYNQTSKNDIEPRKRLHKIFLSKMLKNFGWTVYAKSYILFAIMPAISWQKYTSKLIRYENIDE